jgi:hypothetical protein
MSRADAAAHVANGGERIRSRIKERGWMSADRVLSVVDGLLNRIQQGPTLEFSAPYDFDASDLGQD